jgi:hypothetical protein
MPIIRGLKSYLLGQANATEFDVETGDFSQLEIRQGERPDFFYFYETQERRLIKSFVLRAGPQVDTVCDVVLIQKDGGMTPRLTFWKKDKTGSRSLDLTEEELVAEGRTILIKARVDTGDCHENFSKLTEFLRTCKGLQPPTEVFRVAPAELVGALVGHEKDAVLTAVRTYLSGQVTEQDLRMLVDRRATLATFEHLLNDTDFFADRQVELGAPGLKRYGRTSSRPTRGYSGECRQRDVPSIVRCPLQPAIRRWEEQAMAERRRWAGQFQRKQWQTSRSWSTSKR